MNSKQPLPILALLSIISIGLSQTAAQAENSISNMVKEVMDGTTNAVRNTAHGAGAVLRSTAHAAGAVVQGTARGAGAVVNAAEKAAGFNEDPPYHQPVAGAAVNTAAVQAPASAPVKIAAVSPKTAPVSLVGVSLNIGVDRHGNIIDDSGKLVGRVSVITSDFGAPSDFAGQKLSVTVNGAGEMVDGSGRIIGHILGAEPKIIPVLETPAKELRTPAPLAPATLLAPTQIAPKPVAPLQSAPAPSWTEDDVLKNTAPLMHGLN